MKRLANWLIRGSHPLEPITDEKLDECMFLISQDTFHVYCTKPANSELGSLCAKVPNLVYYCLRSKDEENTDMAELIKVGQFFKMVHDKKTVGIPLAEPDVNSEFYFDRNSEQYTAKVVESWPMVQAYALESIGGGFFSIKHKLANIREKIYEVYGTQDSYTMARLLNISIANFEEIWEQCFSLFTRTSIGKRSEITEADFAAELYLPYELGFMSFDNTDLTNYERKDGLPHPRILIGVNTNGPKIARSAIAPKVQSCSSKK